IVSRISPVVVIPTSAPIIMASRSSSISASISFFPSTRSWICSVKFSLVFATACLIFSKTVGSFFFGVPNRVMNSMTFSRLLLSKLPLHEVVDGVLRFQSFIKDAIHFVDNGHLHTKVLRQVDGGAGGFDAFGNHPHIRCNFFDLLSLTQE